MFVLVTGRYLIKMPEMLGGITELHPIYNIKILPQPANGWSNSRVHLGTIRFCTRLVQLNSIAMVHTS